MKKVLMITYYWPPAGGPGVQRVLKFAKYLPQFGWKPIILTVQNGEYPAYDESLFDDIPPECKVYRTPSIEPFAMYKRFTGMKEDEAIPVAALTEKKIGWKKKLAHWIRLNLFIPDAKIGWIPFAVKAGKHIIKNEKPDVIFSSSPPPTVHLIAKSLARWSGIKWIADFRDPWTKIYHYDSLKRFYLSKYFDEKFEAAVLRKTNITITVSSSIAELLNHKKNCTQSIRIIPNGFDEQEIPEYKQNLSLNKFTLAYAGKINSQQNPCNLWKILGELTSEDNDFCKNFQILLMGNFDSVILNEIRNNGIDKKLFLAGYVSHKETLENLSGSNILLLLIPNTSRNKGILPGKLFEYLAIGKFILGIGPKNGEVAEILNQTNSGKMFEYTDFDNLKSELKLQYKMWELNETKALHQNIIMKYSRRVQTKNLVTFF